MFFVSKASNPLLRATPTSDRNNGSASDVDYAAKLTPKSPQDKFLSSCLWSNSKIDGPLAFNFCKNYTKVDLKQRPNSVTSLAPWGESVRL